MNDTPDPPVRRVGSYEILLALFGGSAIGWFAWWFTGSYGGGSGPPLIAYEAGGVALAGWFVWRLRRRGRTGRRSRWVHLLWIPVVLFALTMVAVIMALRSWQ